MRTLPSCVPSSAASIRGPSSSPRSASQSPRNTGEPRLRPLPALTTGHRPAASRRGASGGKQGDHPSLGYSASQGSLGSGATLAGLGFGPAAAAGGKPQLGAHNVSVPRDAVKTLAWICVAAAAAACIWVVEGRQRGLEFVTGYIIEYSLSVDNLFVFLLVFRFFKVPREAQEAVLFWGILGAMLLRGAMIVVGKALTARFAWVTFGFAALLLYSAGKLLFTDEEDEDDVENNKIVRFVRRILPVHDHYSGSRFFVREGGRLYATPLMVVLVTIELSDVVFAMDSVPAVLGISNDPLVIYASNIFAVMGLRSLFFVISDAIASLRFLRQSLAIVLGFVGVKMLSSLAGRDFDVIISLSVIVGTLVVGISLSYAFPTQSATKSTDDDVEQQRPLSQSRSLGENSPEWLNQSLGEGSSSV